jgi:hypothetical protein
MAGTFLSVQAMSLDNQTYQWVHQQRSAKHVSRNILKELHT